MPSSKRPTLKGKTKKVPPKPHSPPAARDVAKMGRKPPRIREDIPWSPSKVVRRKLAPPDTTIDLTKETSPPSSSNQASAAASTLLSLVTVPTSVAAAASTSLYRQLYSAAEDNHNNEEEQLYSDDYDDEDYVGIHKQPIDEDYDDILDMDIDSEEEFAKEPTECIVLSVKSSTTTQRTAIKSKWREYRVTSTLIWVLKLVKNRRSTHTLRLLFDM